jgi:hypothetical protein
MYKDFNTRLTKLQERAKLSNPRDKLKKLLQDINNLEKFYSDKEYRNTLVSANYPSSEYFQLEHIHEQDRKMKEKLDLPKSSTIRYEKVRCYKDCRHEHYYYYSYIWDCNSKKLKKKYLGKYLPLISTTATII